MSGSTVPVHDGLFDEDPDGALHLIGGHCRGCNRHCFPVGPDCPYCGADGVERVHLSDSGRLWTWTAVTTPPPGYRGAVPFGFGAVELPEGIRVLTRLSEADPDRLSFGQQMTLVEEPLHVDDDGRTVITWSFSPSTATS